ncbi:MAG: YraN family protein [Clostridia bacterium]|nr:YraN family protein [Clostridia bacterium]
MAMPEHLKTGLRGEQLACRYLRKNGYDIIATNYATKLGETDIIARSSDGTICFVEVKTRSPGQMTAPAEAVDYRKSENLKTNAAAFLRATKNTGASIRFDIIEVILHDLYTADINHIKNAF